MNCRYCSGDLVKAGFYPKRCQRYRCKGCQKYQIAVYRYRAYSSALNAQLVALLTEGVGIRGLGRVLGISTTTVLKRIRALSRHIVRPTPQPRATYQLDEMRVVVGCKTNAYWLCYAWCQVTRQVVGYTIGRRNLTNLWAVVSRVLAYNPAAVFTDRLEL